MPNYAGVDLVNLGRKAEEAIGNILCQRGHNIEPPNNYHYDLLCDGIVRIEVKTAYPSGNDIVWAFNSRKRLADFCDVVILIANIDGQARYYVLPADHKIFYNSSGEPKAGIGITKNPCKLKSTGRTLERYYKRWNLICQIRDGKYHRTEQLALF